jgi:hypothetical protein
VECHFWIVQGSRPGWPTAATAGNRGARVFDMMWQNVIRNKQASEGLAATETCWPAAMMQQWPGTLRTDVEAT